MDFVHGYLFTLGIDHKDRIRKPVHVLYALKVPCQLVLFLLDLQDLLFNEAPPIVLFFHGLVLLQSGDTLLDGGEVGQKSSKPALVHEGHSTSFRLLANGFLGLFFCADKEYNTLICRKFPYEPVGLLELPQGLLKINNVNPVPGPEDVPFHLWVPPSGLVAEVHTCLQKLFHRNDRHFILLFSGFCPPLPSIPRRIPLRQHGDSRRHRSADQGRV